MSTGRCATWRKRWAGSFDAQSIDGNTGVKFENAALAYQAVLDPLGVMVALRAFVRDDLLTGRLVARFALQVATRGAYYPSNQTLPGHVHDFVSRIVGEAQAAEG